MIDGSIRKERFKKEAADPSVGVILLDFVLGYGASEDPVGDILPEIIAAKEAVKEAGRHLEVIGYVLGTDSDRQVLTAQIEKLVNAGATYASSNQNASLLAREFVVKGAN